MPVLYGDPEIGVSTPVEGSDERADTVEGLPAALAVYMKCLPLAHGEQPI